jgi:hypothetical protein
LAGLALAMAWSASALAQGVGPVTCDRGFVFNGAGAELRADEPEAANSNAGMDMLVRRHCRRGDVAEIILRGEVATEALARRYCDPHAPREMLPATASHPASLRCHVAIRR